MTLPPTEPKQANGKRVWRNHPDFVSKYINTSSVERAVRELAPSRRCAEVTAIFDNKVVASTIRSWRTGRQPMPQWAADMLAQKLELAEAQRRRVIEHVVATFPIGKGQGFRSDLNRVARAPKP